MTAEAPRISDDAVRNATGRDWDAWTDHLDGRGAADLSHKEIVALVREAGVERGWWQQMVTVGYEKLKGKRVTGETADAGFQVGVQKTVGVPHDEAWRLLTSADGVRAWLGDVELSLEEGATYETADGTAGEVRVIEPESHLRITRRPPERARASTLQVRVVPKGDRTAIVFHEEQLPGEAEREARRAHYRAAAAELAALAR